MASTLFPLLLWPQFAEKLRLPVPFSAFGCQPRRFCQCSMTSSTCALKTPCALWRKKGGSKYFAATRIKGIMPNPYRLPASVISEGVQNEKKKSTVSKSLSAMATKGQIPSTARRPLTSGSKNSEGKRLSNNDVRGLLRPRTSEATLGRSKGQPEVETTLPANKDNILSAIPSMRSIQKEEELTERSRSPCEERQRSQQDREDESVLQDDLEQEGPPWSLTEVLLNSEQEAENGSALESSSEEEDHGSKRTDLKVFKDTPKWRRKKLPWSTVDVDSDEYDTDLEDDFPPPNELPVDASGKYIYEDQCNKTGIVPVSYLMRNLEEGTLKMRHHYLGGTGARPLARALKHNTVCEEIDLSDNYIEGGGAHALASMLKDNMFVVNMNVSDNFIKSEGAEAFAAMLEANTTLKTLSLKGNHLTDSDAKRIAEAMKNNMSLNVLDLSHNEFGNTGGLHIAAGLAANIGLADLDLSWNHIRERGAIDIAKALSKNTSLEILDLSWNGFSANGASVLAASLKVNNTLKVLDISNNRIDADTAKKLAQGISKNSSLETFLIGMNPIGEAGVEALLKGITNNPTLRLVGLEGCVDTSASAAIRKKIEDLESSRDMMIMYTSGSPQQSQTNATVLRVFDKFLVDNSDRMEDLFNQMDKDRSGDVTLEELKYGLKDFGLRLTSKQLDMLLEELDADKSGTIEYSELMSRAEIAKANIDSPKDKARHSLAGL